jgi:lysophospholipase L1-like esterase
VTSADAAEHGYLALGDSYTIGEGVSAAERWPDCLAAGLAEYGNALGSPRIIARTGWSCDELAGAIDAAEPLGRWQLVSLLIGVNDQYRGYPLADYAPRFSALLERAIVLAGDRAERVLVLSIPDWGVTPFAAAQPRSPAQIATEIDACNASARAIAQRHGVPFVDITDLSREHPNAPGMLAADSLHPGPAMYARWAERALPIATHLFSR